MDPNASLEYIRDTLSEFRAADNTGRVPREDLYDYLEAVEDHFNALDRWLTGGGFLPQAWSKVDNNPDDRYAGDPPPWEVNL